MTRHPNVFFIPILLIGGFLSSHVVIATEKNVSSQSSKKPEDDIPCGEVRFRGKFFTNQQGIDLIVLNADTTSEVFIPLTQVPVRESMTKQNLFLEIKASVLGHKAGLPRAQFLSFGKTVTPKESYQLPVQILSKRECKS